MGIFNMINLYIILCVMSFLIMIEHDLFCMNDQDLLPGLCMIVIGPVLLLSIPFIKLYKFLKSIVRFK